MPDIEVRFTIDAFFPFFNKGSAYLHPKKMLVKFVFIIFFHSSSEVFCKSPLSLMPALFTKTSNLPNVVFILCINSLH